jgi:hypothetical protein
LILDSTLPYLPYLARQAPKTFSKSTRTQRIHTTHSQEPCSPCRLLPVICPACLVCFSGDGRVRMDATRVADGCLSSAVRSPGLLWVYGMLTFASGLAVVLGHNVWSNNPAAVVSLLGWLMTIKGAALLLIPATGWKAFLGALHYPDRFRRIRVIERGASDGGSRGRRPLGSLPSGEPSCCSADVRRGISIRDENHGAVWTPDRDSAQRCRL